MTREFSQLLWGTAVLLATVSCIPKKSPYSLSANAIGTESACKVTGPDVVGGGGGTYTLLFCDGFGGSQLNTNNWSTNWTWGDESQIVGKFHDFNFPAVTDETLVAVSNGMLKLKAVDGVNTHFQTKPDQKWTTSAVTGRFKFTYGYLEASIHMPATNGMFPAFWLLSKGLWPPEIDIAEEHSTKNPNGSGYQYMLSTNYWWKNGTDNQSDFYLFTNDDLVSTGFCTTADASCEAHIADKHTYGVAWTPTDIRYYYDGKEVYSKTGGAPVTDQPHYVIIQLGVGGWSDVPNSDTDWSKAHLDVDWVRLWEMPGQKTTFTMPSSSPTSIATAGSSTSGSTTSSTTSSTNGQDCAGNIYCKDGWGWLGDGEGGCSSTSPAWKGNGCSCNCSSQSSTSTSSAGQASPPTLESGSYPSCNGNRYCKDGWGWLLGGEGGCSSESAGWKGTGCSCSCSSDAIATTPAQQQQQQASTGGGGESVLSCNGNRHCENGWGWLNLGESGCSSSSPGWNGNGCNCTCKSGDSYIICPSSKYCTGTLWGFLASGEAGCSAASGGWKGNGCSCKCH